MAEQSCNMKFHPISNICLINHGWFTFCEHVFYSWHFWASVEFISLFDVPFLLPLFFKFFSTLIISLDEMQKLLTGVRYYVLFFNDLGQVISLLWSSFSFFYKIKRIFISSNSTILYTILGRMSLDFEDFDV